MEYYRYATNFRFIDISSSEAGNILQVNGYGMGIGFAPPAYGSADKLYVNGNVGIGTTVPDQKLTVNGTIHASQVKVDTQIPVADYVFKKDYKLTSLQTLKTYLDKNQHLPEIPSASEQEKEGLDLGKMNQLLLKKVEELTLYLIEKDKKDKALEAKVSKLTSEMIRLKKSKN